VSGLFSLTWNLQFRPFSANDKYFSLWLNNTAHTHTHTHTVVSYPFIRWWAPRLIPYFGYLNSAAINMCVQVSLCILTCIPLDICSGVVRLDHILFLVFWGTSILTFKVAVLIYNFHQHCIRVPFTTESLPAFVCFLDDCHSDWGEMESQHCFDLHFFMVKDAEHFFICLLSICTSSLRTVCSIHFSIYLFFWCFKFLSSLYILDINPLMNSWQGFSLIL
jgi:hypothetical protein